MKPPKSIRNIVHTLLGNKKRNKSSPNSSISLAEPTALHPGNLDKNSRHHRSADDLLDDDTDFNLDRFASVSTSARSRSLPRRSQSCLAIQRPSVMQRPESKYGARIVSVDHDFDHHQQRRNGHDNTSGGTSTRSSSRNSASFSRPSSQIARSTSLHSVNQNRTRRTQSSIVRSRFDADEGYGDSLPRTTSWSDNSRPLSLDKPVTHHRPVNSEITFHDRDMIRPASKLQPLPASDTGSSSSRERFASHEHLSKELPRRAISKDRGSRTISHTSTGTTTDEKLRTCLHVLDRLSAQVQEIKDVSKRVQNVDNEVKHGALHRGERERRLRELDMAEAASRRLKSLLKATAEEMPKTRLSSRSSGYDSGDSSRRNSTSPQQSEAVRTSRPSGRMSQDSLPYPSYQGHPTSYPHSQPYPQSVSDMMPIWDAKNEAEWTQLPRGPQMTRDDSMSSGYATGSGSEDGRHGSPVATDSDSISSLYREMRANRQFHQNQQQAQHPSHQQQQWQAQYYQQQQYKGYPAADYDPYTAYHGYHPQMGPNGPVGQDENIYGNYGEIFGYASSSLYDNEVYSDGWYRLPVAPSAPAPQAVQTEATMIAPADPHHQQQATMFNQSWCLSTYPAQPPSTKYGGLSDLFYDPSVQSSASVMENIAKEYASEAPETDESTWKTYGSFRYRNGQRTVLSSGTAARKRKTVRFSQTVRQRVETEESEMEDSTSVIKGGCDEHEENVPNNESRTSDLDASDSSDPSEIYMSPRQHQVSNLEDNKAKALPEPIYEFPSGHIESSCMCGDCILARGSCQMQSAPVAAYF